MEELKDLLKLFLGFAFVGVCLWLYLKLNLFFYERGWISRYRRPKNVEIQTLFHGNTKDDKNQL